MKLWIVVDSREDWLHDIVPAEDESEALQTASRIFQQDHIWDGQDHRDEFGNDYAMIYVLEWQDTSVSANQYYNLYCHRACVFYVPKPVEEVK